MRSKPWRSYRRSAAAVPGSAAVQCRRAAPVRAPRFRAHRLAARLLSGASGARGCADIQPAAMSSRRELFLEEMGLTPLWRLRTREVEEAREEEEDRSALGAAVPAIVET